MCVYMMGLSHVIHHFLMREREGEKERERDKEKERKRNGER